MRASLPTLAILGVSACHKGNTIRTEGDPPFEIASARSVLWAQDPATDAQDGMAILVISPEEMACTALTSQDFYYGLDDVVMEGRGLMFVLEYDSWGSDVPPQGWEGLWMTGYGFSGDAERMMFPLAFSDGFIYMLGGYYGIGVSSWLIIDSWAADGVRGSYSTEYWSGDFNAENCGSWAPHDVDDTGWDSCCW